ncbi:ABC transporter ATP-binding protein [Aromatoleum toluclasticum]|uniref:zinc ABC transporter ATP-binding protein AztA n=1 Tax=Aromatoleum toluclasticum TaxID=92003 RepID=UPI001D1882E4|nr:zinc ABC transporter ATP-binding protein AztA [Aromatoleum toluclasticum]MCC4115445.1 ABC transporter ATP-binding protein [Aromatoleum toluclasticum]
MNTHDAILELDNLTLGYDRHPAIHHLRCRIARGALVAIVGPNGAGKSTLFKALTGELQPLQGHFRVNAGKEGIAYLPQQSELDRSFPVSIFDMVSMGLWREIGAFRGLSRSQAERVRTALAAVGLSGFEARQIGTLSGGQLQRARFARMMLQDANLLLLDEPFNAIDARTIEDLVALILHWHAEGRTILAVLHDLTLVRHHFPETLLLARECVGFGPTDEILTPEHLATARRLAGEFDATAPVCHRPEAEAA